MALSFHSTISRTPISKKVGVLWTAAAQEVLGTSYDASVVFVGNTTSHRLNKTYRGKDKPTNVLAFPISKTSGEIYLNPAYAKREAALFDHTEILHLTYLFMHGLLHLKGHDHGTTMERHEKRLMKKYASKIKS